MGREYNEAQKRAAMKYMQDKTDDIRLRLPKGTKDRWKAAAEAKGVSMTKFVQDVVEAAVEVKPAGQWISVKDKLPEDNGFVVCLYLGQDGIYYPTVGTYAERPYGRMDWFTDMDCTEGGIDEGIRVTHWMPLPKPPKTNEKAEA